MVFFKLIFKCASLGQIPDNDEQKVVLFDRLLSANLFGQDSGNGWFAKDSQFNQILFICRIPLRDLSLPIFTSQLKKMISTLSHWSEVVKNLSCNPLKNTLTDEKSDFFIKI